MRVGREGPGSWVSAFAAHSSSPFGEMGSLCAGAAAVDDQERDERRLDRLVGEADEVQRLALIDREVGEERQRGVADQQGAGDGLEAAQRGEVEGGAENHVACEVTEEEDGQD